MRIGILSDAHGNAESLIRGVSVLRRCGADEIWFLGDAVGYLPGAACLEVIAEEGLIPLRGNHEDMLALDTDLSIKDDVYQHEKTLRFMTPKMRARVAAWPEKLSLSISGTTLHAYHGSPASPITGYVYPDTPLDEFVRSAEPADIVVTANTHLPFVREHRGIIFVNSGSCGLPRDDGRLGAATICDLDSLEVSVLRFDIVESTRAALARVGSVHESVRAVFDRRSQSVVGRMV